MTKLNDAFASTKQRFAEAQTSPVGAAVRTTVEVQRHSLEQLIAVARKNSAEAAPKPTQVVADVRQYFADVAGIQKDSVQQLRDAWKPVYEQAATRVTEGVTEAKERAFKFRDKAEKADDVEGDETAETTEIVPTAVIVPPADLKPARAKSAGAKPVVAKTPKA